MKHLTVVVLGSVLFASCSLFGPSGPGIVTTGSGPGSGVYNGHAFDKGTMDISAYDALILPHDAQVKENEALNTTRTIHVLLRKTLSFGGHPPASVTPLQARKFMGVAWRAEDRRIWFGTYGEWDSHIEGGASMHVIFEVPSNVKVERAHDLSFENSKADGWKNGVLIKGEEHWYGGNAPAEGWTALQTVPDEDAASTFDD
ncbi:MAG: hypothetical protein L6Q71_11470 [Planctomycetes bacterium]|nr:hypothetical protein [Planctomycetota bacterium]NUQ34391.1 hypothetical protein [Planctomycetaceae bacterium]